LHRNGEEVAVHRFPNVILVVLVVCAASPALADDLVLVPGELPRVVTLPPGVTPNEVRVEVIDVHYVAMDPTPQPSSRTFFVGRMPVSVARSASASPVDVRSGTVHGRPVLMLGANARDRTGRVASVVVRLLIARGGPRVPLPDGWRPVRPRPEPVLAIVTTGHIAERSKVLDRYVRWREAQGLRVVVGTEADWDMATGQRPDRAPERIRAWLRSVRDEVGLGAVLLVGDPDPQGRRGVPMKLTHPLSAVIGYYPPDLASVLEPVPTDHYYADLDGDWDLDGDDRFGEYPDDEGDGGLSWDPQALVGRIPVYHDDIDRLDRTLEAIMEYESDPDPGFRHRVLLAAAFIGFGGQGAPGGGTYEVTNDGAVAAEALRPDVLELDGAAEVLRFYEEDGIVTSGYEHERPLTRSDILTEWSQGAGIFAAFSHGSHEGDYRTVWDGDWNEDGIPDWSELGGDAFISSGDSIALLEAPPAFTFHSACMNSWPEAPNNLGASLLGSGAIATVAATRAAIGSDVDFEPDPGFADADTMAYAFTRLLLEGHTAGEAVAYLRYGLPADEWGYEEGIPLNGYGWLGKLEFNLYGDPLVGLGRCEDDADCDDGSACTGTASCVDGYCVRGEAADCSRLDDVCMVGQCDAATGECRSVPRPDGTPCDDGSYCTVDDACASGECVAMPRSCGEAPPGFVTACDEELTACVLEPAAGPEPDAGPDGGEPPDLDLRGGGGCSTVARPGPAVGRLLGLP
jgi:hypothetical protein